MSRGALEGWQGLSSSYPSQQRPIEDKVINSITSRNLQPCSGHPAVDSPSSGRGR
jgi:hypothetical protein